MQPTVDARCRAIHRPGSLRLLGLLARACLIAVLALVLMGCGASSSTQTVQTEHYQVQLTLDGTGFGERTATIEVRDRAGEPVVADQVVIAPVMRQMGMASPEVTAQPVAPGRYQAKGEFFSMTGEWQIDVRIQVNGNEELATFELQVAP
jgi:hypothetical protein